MRIVLLDTLTFGDTDLGGFDRFGEVLKYETTSSSQTQERITNANVIVTNKVVIDDTLMAHAKELRLICIAATGMNNVDLEAAKKRGIVVKNVSGYSTDSVVQHTFAMLLYLLEHSRYYDDVVKSGAYAKSPIFTDVSRPFFEIKNKKWGIIGMGEIGRGVAKVAQAFGAEVWYHSTSGANTAQPFVHANLPTLLSECDIISIHAPLNEKTKNLLGYEELLACRKKAIVLNLGRGGIIDEEAVARIVDEREIYFGLDVLEREPMREDHPFLSVQNQERLYVTPHIAWTSREAREKLIAGVIENIETFLRG
ncbi:MAG: D-2-hydroxyacid dehydrogenase [Sulfurimonadaceae bacterium]